MLSFFRSLAKSTFGKIIAALVLLLILASFAMSDISNFGTGDFSFGFSSGTLVKVGGHGITDREMRDAMQRRLKTVREQNPTADYASIASEFDPLLDQLIDQRAILAFADDNGFPISKRLIDAEISQLPGVKGFNDKASVQGYQQFLSQAGLSDQQARQILTTQIIARNMIIPVSDNARVPVGVATPYASMLMEAREGDAAVVPFTSFTVNLKPTDADLRKFYLANRARYTVPEQRALRIARIGPEQVASVTASDQEIAAYYNANQATYGSRDTRSFTQAVVPDQAAANAIAARARGGASIAEAAKPAGANAAVTVQKDQTRQAYRSIAGDAVAAAVFSAKQGAVVGPVRSEFGWVVAKVDSVKSTGGKSLAAAKAEIAAKLTATKRQAALEDVVAKLQDTLDAGANFTETANGAKLAVTTTPLIFANGTSKTDPNYKLPAELAPALKSGFEIAANDPPEVPELGPDKGYAMVAPMQIIPAAPAPLASIRDRVAADWTRVEGLKRARAAAEAIAARAGKGMSLADAIKQGGVPLPVQPLSARRIQIAEAQGRVPPPIRMLFTLVNGAAKMVPDPQGRGFFVVKVNKIVPGNAALQFGLIAQMQRELSQEASDDYARQLVAAMRADLKVKRNDKAIKALKQQLTSSGG
jgi:peptidyl-prolyl cis-trans isomerase D